MRLNITFLSFLSFLTLVSYCFAQPNGWHDVKSEFGAIGDGVHDDSPNINKAISAIVASSHGGTLYFPPGQYRCANTLCIPRGKQITIVGNGWRPPAEDFADASGSWIKFDARKSGEFTKDYDKWQGLKVENSGTRIENLGFAQPSNLTGEHRADNQNFAAISIYSASDISIENVILLHVPVGIWIANGGRVSVNRLNGNPFQVGIQIRRSLDVVKLNDIHFWSYTENEGYLAEKQKGTAIDLLRADNPQISNVFVISYGIGVYFGENEEGYTQRCKISNIDCDHCGKGLFVNASHVSCQVTNFSFLGKGEDRYGVYIRDGIVGAMVQISNADLHLVEGNGFRVPQESTVRRENVWKR